MDIEQTDTVPQLTLHERRASIRTESLHHKDNAIWRGPLVDLPDSLGLEGEAEIDGYDPYDKS